MAAILELQGISKHFGKNRVVDDVTLEVERGMLFSLLGPSGCGKTTTLRLVAGFEKPSSGEILLNGSRIDGLKPYQRNVTTVFQNYALFPFMTVRANVEFGLRRRGLEKGLMDHRVREALELVQLTGKEDRMPSQLSGGEKQRVALARSLVLQPDVLLLDEPLSALDSNLRKQVRAELRELQRSVGVTFVLVTHDQEEALSTSDRIAIMNAGRIEQVGTPQQLYLQPNTRFIAGFLGDVNWIGQVGVRPEATRIARQAPAQEVRSIPSVVETLTFLGNTIHVHAKSATGQRITAEVSRLDDGFKPGEAVHVWWRPSDEIHTPSDR